MKFAQFETTDPILMDKELHHGEAENKFNFGDNNKDEMINFIQGHNTELDRKEFSTINYIILISSISIVIVVLVVVISVLLCGKKKLTYEQQENDFSNEDQPNEINTSDENTPDPNNNKISFEENNPPETNLEDNK